MRNYVLGAALAVTATALATAPLAARGRDRGETFMITPNQVVDMADARIAQLKADLRLNPDQDKNWGSFQTALHDMGQRRADRMNKMREQRSVNTDGAANTPANSSTTQSTAPANQTAAPVVNDRDARRDDRDYRRDDRDSRSPDLVAEMRRQADTMSARADDFRKFADRGRTPLRQPRRRPASPLHGVRSAQHDGRQRRRRIPSLNRNSRAGRRKWIDLRHAPFGDSDSRDRPRPA